MNANNYTKHLREAVSTLRQAGINARGGLPEDIFLLVSALTPIPNVDLLITDARGQILLSRRDDSHFGKGWHIPGGCIRFGETMAERIQATARNEIGCEVHFSPNPIVVCDVFSEPRAELVNPDERGHHLAMLFDCTLPKGYIVNNGLCTENDSGYLKWFKTLPEDFLRVHDVYYDYLNKWHGREAND